MFLICCCSHVNIFLPFTFSERMARRLPPVPSAPCPQHETDVLPVALVALGGDQCCVRPSENWLLGAYRCWWSLGLSENPRASVRPALHLLRRLLVRGPTKATPTEAWPAGPVRACRLCPVSVCLEGVVSLAVCMCDIAAPLLVLFEQIILLKMIL